MTPWRGSRALPRWELPVDATQSCSRAMAWPWPASETLPISATPCAGRGPDRWASYCRRVQRSLSQVPQERWQRRGLRLKRRWPVRHRCVGRWLDLQANCFWRRPRSPAPKRWRRHGPLLAYEGQRDLPARIVVIAYAQLLPVDARQSCSGVMVLPWPAAGTLLVGAASVLWPRTRATRKLLPDEATRPGSRARASPWPAA